MQRGRVLVIDHKVPTPDQDSGSASTLAFLRILARAGFKVIFAPADLAGGGRYRRQLRRRGIRVLTAAKWSSLAEVIEAIGPRVDVVLLYRGSIAGPLVDLVREAAPQAKIAFHPVDLHFLRLAREAEALGDPALARVADATRRLELDVVRAVDATIVVSQYEADLIRRLLPPADVTPIPILRAVPRHSRGMAAAHLALARLPRSLGDLIAGRLARLGAGPKARRDIVFIGGYAHTPNVDAVLWFVRKVWPRVLANGFRGRFIIAGSNVPESLRALRSDRIEVVGHVADLALLFGSVRISVAPLRYGAGIKGKIVTSLSHSVPVVATGVAVEGMGLVNGESVLVADDPESMAAEIVRLYSDPALWLRLSSNGFHAFLDTFSEPAGEGKIISLFDRLVDQSRRGRTGSAGTSASRPAAPPRPNP